MPFSEDDLRQALRRKDPGPEFTQQVMARLKQPEGERSVRAEQKHRKELFWLPQIRFAPALGFALALLLAIGTWVGYLGYQQHQREREAAKQAEQQREMEAKRAEQQAILALRITSEKLNHVFQKVNGAAPPEDKIRRQRL